MKEKNPNINVRYFYHHFLQYSKKYPKLRNALIFALLIQNIGFILISLLLKTVFEQVLQNKMAGMPVFYLLSTFVAVLITAGSYFFTDYLSIKIGTKIINHLRLLFYKKIQCLPIDTLNQFNTNRLLSSYSEDFALLRTAANFSLWYSLAHLAFIPVGLLVLTYINWSLTLALILLQPLFNFLSRLCVKAAGAYAKQRKNLDVKSLGMIKEEIVSQLMSRVLQASATRSQTFSNILKQTEQTEFKHQYLIALTKTTVSTGQQLLRTGCIGLGAIWVFNDWMNISALIAYSILLNSVTACVNLYANQLSNLIQGAHTLKHILDFIDYEEPQKIQGTQAFTGLQSAIEFKQVQLIKDDRMILNNINLKIAKGQNVLITGASGAGKTSLLKLLLAQDCPSSGNIMLDGQAIESYCLDSYYQHIGLVMHEPHLFQLSILENIRLGKLNATDSQVFDAAKFAGIHQEILNMPLGYETLVAEDGSNLSAGQCKRLAIARALISQPSILLLDEITANLDKKNKTTINEILRKIAHQVTVIRISHDEDDIYEVDVSYKIDQGQLVIGSLDTLALTEY